MTRGIAAGVAAVLAVGAVGCGSQPRPIEEAKPVRPVNGDSQGVVVLPTTPAPSESDPAAAAVVADAVKAHTGGKPDLLDKLRSVAVTREGSTSGPGAFSMTWQIRGVYPDRCRVDAEIAGRPRMTIARTGGSAWQHADVVGVQTEPLAGEQLRGAIADYTYEWLAVLAPLGDKSVVATPFGDRTVGRKPATGVRLSGPTLPNAVAFFDKETRHLVGFAYQGSEGGSSVVKEVVVLGEEPVNGVSLPSKLSITWDGRPAVEWEVKKVEFPADIAPKVFDGP